MDKKAIKLDIRPKRHQKIKTILELFDVDKNNNRKLLPDNFVIHILGQSFGYKK